MKVLYCTKCGDIRAFEERWTKCRCGLCAARWKNPYAGTVEILTSDYSLPRIIGMHNGFLLGASEAPASETFQDQFHRDLQDRVTNAPGYLFDKSKRGSWACVIRVGESSDVWFSPWCAKIQSGEILLQDALGRPYEIPENFGRG